MEHVLSLCDRLFLIAKVCMSVSINITSERIVTLTGATKYVPRRRRGKPTHVGTIYRWADPGLRGIRLEVLRIGGTLCTSVEALQRFFDRLTAIPPDCVPPSQDQPAAADDADVDQRFDELGF